MKRTGSKAAGCAAALPPKGMDSSVGEERQETAAATRANVLYFISGIKRNTETRFLRRGAFISLRSV